MSESIFFKSFTNASFCFVLKDIDLSNVDKNIDFSIKHIGTKSLFFCANFSDYDKNYEYLELKINNQNFQIFDYLRRYNVKVLTSEKIENKKILYCFCSFLSKFIIYKNTKINLQISIEDDFVFLGYPIIYSSY